AECIDSGAEGPLDRATRQREQPLPVRVAERGPPLDAAPGVRELGTDGVANDDLGASDVGDREPVEEPFHQRQERHDLPGSRNRLELGLLEHLAYPLAASEGAARVLV